MFAPSNDHRKFCKGFTLLELMVSTVVMLTVVGGIVSLLSTSEQMLARTEIKSDMYENVRGVAELMTQEVGQAGLVSLPPATLTSAVALVGVATVNVSSTASMFQNESVLVGAGASEEPVTISALTATTITANFGKPHVVGTPITALGVFPNGIVPPGAADGSTPTVLNIFGDINGDGSLVYVRYVCTTGTAAAPGTLSRSITTIAPGVNAISASQNLLTTLVANPAPLGTACFQYTTQAAAGQTFVSQLGITLTVQAAAPDPNTGLYSTMTKSFLNLEPRNIMAGLDLGNAGITNRFQVAPPNVALY
jgi:prepilin-type N-terminal cleavage/methylation domain-containing protein